MNLSLREAATLLERSPRTLRAQLARGDVAGAKHGGRWTVERRSLPLTESQRATIQARADVVRETVERALPSRVARRRDDRRRSLADVAGFRTGAFVWREMAIAVESGEADDHDSATTQRPQGDRIVVGSIARARAALGRSLLDLARGSIAFEPDEKLHYLRRARGALDACVALLLLGRGATTSEQRLVWVERLETELLPLLAGLLRWSERLAEKRR